jgi:Xaa-Pro aminopeptidase
MNPSRREILQQFIREHQLGMLVFWRPDELVLLLGYMPFWGLSFLVYTDGAEPILYVPEAEPEDILPKDITTITFPWGAIDCADPWEVFYEKLTAQLTGTGNRKRRISYIRSIGGTAPCRMTAEQPPLPANLADRLAGCCEGGFLDLAPCLTKLYQYKNPQDISRIKQAHRAAERAAEKFYELARPGITEVEMAGQIETAVQNMTGTAGIQFAKAWPMVQSGNNAAFGGRYNRSTGKKLQEAEMVLLEIGICVDGYWADITRTAAVGKIPPRQEQVFNIVREAQQQAISLMRPGIEMAAVDAAARNYIETAGYGHLYNHGLGHHVGFRYHDPGPPLSPSSTGILEEGMVLTVEPGIYGQEIGSGVRIEDNILVTAGGYELLSDFSNTLTGE